MSPNIRWIMTIAGGLFGIYAAQHSLPLFERLPSTVKAVSDIASLSEQLIPGSKDLVRQGICLIWGSMSTTTPSILACQNSSSEMRETTADSLDHSGDEESPQELQQTITKSQSSPKVLTYDDYTIGWIAALPKELTAAMTMLDEIHSDLPKPLNDDNTYLFGAIGKHNIVIACLPKGQYGTISAAAVAVRMISSFPSMRMGLMVGIGGGIPSSNVSLGDVVIGIPKDQYPGVVQWDLGKATDSGFERIGSLNNPPNALLSALSRLESKHDAYGSKIPQYIDRIKSNWPRLISKYMWSERRQDPNAENGEPRKPEDILIHYGLIASGNRVIKSERERNQINEQLGGNVLCIEMEAAGLMNNFPCIIIRGICDYADSRKNDDWQEYAATVASAYARELLEVLQPSQVDAERPVREILGEITNSTSRIESKLDNMATREVLNWLSPVNYGFDYSEILAQIQNGTGQWFLKSPEYQMWFQSGSKNLYSPGLPGAGKTCIATLVIHDLLNKFRSDRSTGIAFIYASFKRQAEQNVQHLLETLVRQLSQDESTFRHVKLLYDQHHQRGETRPQYNEVLSSLQSVSKEYQRIYIVIDALDELDDFDSRRTQFLQALFNIQQMSNLSIFATSRSLPDINSEFERDIKLEISATTEDVARYLDGQMSNLSRFRRASEDLKDFIKIRILEATMGMFLVASRLLELLADMTTAKSIKTTLNNLPNGSATQMYHYLYNSTMQRILSRESDRRTLAMQVLSWTTFAEIPLKISDLQLFLAVETGKTELDTDNIPDVEDIISVCEGLVTMNAPNGILQLAHYTVKEYFNQTWTYWFPSAEATIADACVTYLLLDLFKESPMIGSSDHNTRWNPINVVYFSLWRSPYNASAFQYAARSWGHHARKAGQISEGVFSFLQSPISLRPSCKLLLWSHICTGLHLMAHFGLDDETLFQAVLLGNGTNNTIDPDSLCSYGWTPLYMAAISGNEGLVKLLLNTGKVEINRIWHRNTILCSAALKGREAIVQILLDTRKVDLDIVDDCNGLGALFLAAEEGDKDEVKLVLDEGIVDVDEKNIWGTTPLYQAAKNGHEAIVSLLLNTGKVDVNTRDKRDGTTPLFQASKNGHTAVVRLLLDSGKADIFTEDIWDKELLSEAKMNGHEDIIELLQIHGAKNNPVPSASFLDSKVLSTTTIA